jgi:hypothetical protein
MTKACAFYPYDPSSVMKMRQLFLWRSFFLVADNLKVLDQKYQGVNHKNGDNDIQRED